LTPRDPAFSAWDSVPPEEKKVYAHQMEVYAGYQENTDHAVARVVQAIKEMGLADNTLVIYIFGDNGASMEGTENGTFNEIITLNGIPLTAEQQLKAIKAYGGLEKWGGPDMDPHYASAWAWAGNTPFKWGKQVASHLGGIRNPMVVSWPKSVTQWSLAGQNASRTKAACATNSLTAPTSLQLSWKLPVCRSRKKLTASRRCRCMA
ncbi:MAG: hypothetical protein DME84_01145, partial [Verrucomicrobia bacterium]